jgi:hypothetical protein
VKFLKPTLFTLVPAVGCWSPWVKPGVPMAQLLMFR